MRETRIWPSVRSVPLKFRLGVARGHWKWYQSVAWLYTISVSNLCGKTHRSATIHDRDNDTCTAICAFTVRDAPNKKRRMTGWPGKKQRNGHLLPRTDAVTLSWLEAVSATDDLHEVTGEFKSRWNHLWRFDPTTRRLDLNARNLTGIWFEICCYSIWDWDESQITMQGKTEYWKCRDSAVSYAA